MKTNDPRSDLSRALVLSWAAVSSKMQDKYSIEDQLKLERDWCKRNGATIVDELVVRGFSRDYWTLDDVVNAASHDPEMAAFARLQAHLRKRDFNVFLCFDADRFGRTQSLVHEIIGRVTRDCNALIYTLFDGVWMDAESGPTIGTIKAYKAQQDVARLRDYRITGMYNRAQDGKSTSTVTPMFHKRLRDEKGKEVAIVINEDYRPLWTDLATLILRGVSWQKIEKVLFEEFGHGANGKPYPMYKMRRMVFLPTFWGNAAINYRYKDDVSTQNSAPWIWDTNIPPPEGITVYPNRLPPVYGGEWSDLGERVKAELWRRHHLKGKATPQKTFRFHGLVVCDECGYAMNWARGKKPTHRTYMRCETRYGRRHERHPKTCSQNKYIAVDTVQAYIHAQLSRALKGNTALVFDVLENTATIERRIDEEARRLVRLEKRAESLIVELTSAPENLRAVYRRQINQVSEDITQSNETLIRMRGELANSLEVQSAQASLLETLRASSIDWLWQQPDTVIHQLLSVALGNNQLVVRDGEIIGVAPATTAYILKRREKNLRTV